MALIPIPGEIRSVMLLDSDFSIPSIEKRYHFSNKIKFSIIHYCDTMRKSFRVFNIHLKSLISLQIAELSNLVCIVYF